MDKSILSGSSLVVIGLSRNNFLKEKEGKKKFKKKIQNNIPKKIQNYEIWKRDILIKFNCTLYLFFKIFDKMLIMLL